MLRAAEQSRLCESHTHQAMLSSLLPRALVVLLVRASVKQAGSLKQIRRKNLGEAETLLGVVLSPQTEDL